MDESLYTVDRIAELLHMHPKTIQRYIREGKLRAAKLGKSWRVTGHDLSVFLQAHDIRPAAVPAPEVQAPRVRASAVVDITVSGEDEANRFLSALQAAMQSRPPEWGQASLVTQYVMAESLARISLWGSAAFMAAVFDIIDQYFSQPQAE